MYAQQGGKAMPVMLLWNCASTQIVAGRTGSARQRVLVAFVHPDGRAHRAVSAPALLAAPSTDRAPLMVTACALRDGLATIAHRQLVLARRSALAEASASTRLLPYLRLGRAIASTDTVGTRARCAHRPSRVMTSLPLQPAMIV